MADDSFRQSLLTINRAGRNIEMMTATARRIRLRSLNALILARHSGATARSYSVVAREMIQSTAGFRQAADDLRRMAGAYLHDATVRLRNLLSIRLSDRCEGRSKAALARSFQARETELRDRLRKSENRLLVTIRAATEQCFTGNMVATQALIEGSAISREGDSYITVATEYMESVASISSALVELGAEIENLRQL